MNPWNTLLAPVRIPPSDGTGRVHYIDTDSWGLTRGQVQILGDLVKLGSTREVARKLGKSIKTIEEQCARARQKMGARSNLEAALMFDRMDRKRKDAE